MRSERGFTLLELLIVVAIVALLVGLTAVSMRTVRASVSRSNALTSLRDMSRGHTQYTQEHGWRLLPGYIDTTFFEPNEEFERLVVKQPSGTVLAPGDRQSYVWRLAPYLDNAWQTFFADTADTGAMSRFNADFAGEVFGPASTDAALGGISERPSYGMNSIYVGGDSLHGDECIRAHCPWNRQGSATIAATRFTEILKPARLIVFGAAAKVSSDGDSAYEDPFVGYCELRPPYYKFCCILQMWVEPQWMVGTQGDVWRTNTGHYDAGAGFPIDRRGGDRVPIVHADGSTVVEQIGELARDMRRWRARELELRKTQEPSPL